VSFLVRALETVEKIIVAFYGQNLVVLSFSIFVLVLILFADRLLRSRRVINIIAPAITPSGMRNRPALL